MVVPDGADGLLQSLTTQIRTLSQCSPSDLHPEAQSRPEQQQQSQLPEKRDGLGTNMMKKMGVRWWSQGGESLPSSRTDETTPDLDKIRSATPSLPIRQATDTPLFSGTPRGGISSPPPHFNDMLRSMSPDFQPNTNDPQNKSSAAYVMIPFELRALESVLMILCDMLEKEVGTLRDQVLSTTHSLTHSLGGAFLEHLRQQTNDVAKMVSRITGIRSAVATLLEDDADMALMRLTKVFQNPERYSTANVDEWAADHEDVELLLENYAQLIEDIFSRITLLQQEIQDSENIINLRLNVARNSLLQVNIMVYTVTGCSAVSGLLGTM
jgi:hypothetical protein